jgi:hypothetical protein
MGFDDRFINWIKIILDSGSSSILVNGVPGIEFKCRREVRQGDPLSPFYLLLVLYFFRSLLIMHVRKVC